MNLYAVVFDSDEETTETAIEYAKSRFEEKDCFSLCSNVLLVKSEWSVRTLTRRLKLSKETDYTAIAFHLDDQFAGYYFQSAWDWLKDALEEVES